MFLELLIPIVEKVAPFLASALKGPFSSIAIKILAKHFGFDENQLEAFKDKILSDPASEETQLKIRECETKNLEEIKKISNERYALETERYKLQIAELQEARKAFLNNPLYYHASYILLGIGIVGLVGCFYGAEHTTYHPYHDMFIFTGTFLSREIRDVVGKLINIFFGFSGK